MSLKHAVPALLLLLAATFALAAGAVGEKLPTLKLRDLENQDVGAEAHAGKPRIYVFFMTWSPGSKALLAELKPLAPKLREKDVAVYAVSLDLAGAAKVADFVKKEGLSGFPVLLAEQSASRALNLKHFPTTLAVDAAGTIQARLDGAARAADVEAMVAKLKP